MCVTSHRPTLQITPQSIIMESLQRAPSIAQTWGICELTEDTIRSSETFCLNNILYGVPNTDYVDAARHTVYAYYFPKTGKKEENVQLTSDGCPFSISMHYQTMVWRNASCTRGHGMETY